jgi:hypothetical protein
MVRDWLKRLQVLGSRRRGELAVEGQMLILAQNGFPCDCARPSGHGRSSQSSSRNDMDGYADYLAA